MKNVARRVAIDSIKVVAGGKIDPTPRIDQFLEYFMTRPESLDPAGIVPKVEHVVDAKDRRFKDEIELLARALGIEYHKGVEAKCYG